MPDFDLVDGDIVLDIILELLDIHWDYIGERVEIIDGDLPFDVERLEVIITNPEVREIVAARVRDAQAAGRAFPLPSGQELAAARERQLARRQGGS